VKQRAFEREHRQRWSDFAGLLAEAEQAGRRYRLAHAADAERFIADYRALCRDLSIAKARVYSPTLIAYLNDLVMRGHNVIYARRRGHAASALAFFATGFPHLVRAERAYVAVAALTFVGTAVAMGVALAVRPELIFSLLDPEQVASFESMYDPEGARIGTERGARSDFAMFGHYVWNNVSIGFRTFATGLLAGVGTLFILAFNGVYIGAVAVHLIAGGYGSTFLPFVVGHGAFELTAIVLCGAAGLRLGHAFLAPGTLPRRQALIAAARVGVRVLLGAAAMLLVAAFIEAFWSAMQWPGAMAKYVVGAALWLFVFSYFLFGGRRRGSVAP
jgi:uncharacterized membrane protein SpoIIM required for sporulation